ADGNRVVRRIEVVGVCQIQHAFCRTPGVESPIGTLHEKPTLDFADTMPRTRPREMNDADRVSDRPQKNERDEDDREIDGEEGSTVPTKCTSPKRSYVGCVGRAPQTGGRFN